ncbi:MAG TPA: class II aldolase/adducin family protein [Blastocatellia bacterium]|nr:class II aldolase/adducin family protein [Blastocatellia bacterium]
MNENLKFDLCCAARTLYRQGMSAGIAGHISIKVSPDTMIVNRFGPSFGTVTPSDILTVDFNGKILEGTGWVNDTIRLHGVVHRLNPNHAAVMHTHPPTVVTWSTLQKPLEIYDQESCILADLVGVVQEEYDGLASTEDRVRPVAEELRTHPAVILPNHGAITAGPNVQMALFFMITLEYMAQRNMSVAAAARNTGITPRPIAIDAARRARDEIMKMPALEPLWRDLLARLKKTDPELFGQQEQSVGA